MCLSNITILNTTFTGLSSCCVLKKKSLMWRQSPDQARRMTSWIKQGLSEWRALWQTRSGLCYREGGVRGNREWVLQPLTGGSILGWWLHEWSLAVTAAWMMKSIRSTCIPIHGRAKHRLETTHGVHLYTFWAHIPDRDKAKLLNRVKMNSLINQMSVRYTYTDLVLWTHSANRPGSLFLTEYFIAATF